MSPDAGRIALVGADRQIYVADLASGARRVLTLSKRQSPLARWGRTESEERSVWPCWSPDGRWIACFQTRRTEEDPSVVSVVQVDGVEERELVELSRAAPIYASWSADSASLAVLSQGSDALELGVVPLNQSRAYRVVERGVPLFFSWNPDGARLLLHVGDRAQRAARLVSHDLRIGASVLLSEAPGAFCTPVFAGSRPVVVSDHLGASWVSTPGSERGRSAALATFEGLLAMVPEPGGAGLVVGAAPRGEGSPYAGLWRVALDGGEVRRLTEQDCMAFFVTPDGSRVVYASVDRSAGCLLWRVVDLSGGPPRELCPFWPSPEQLFYLHFFEQFALSHSPISADGRTLVFSGLVGLPGQEGEAPPCHVLALDIHDPDAQPRSLGEGSFAVAAPGPSAV